MNFRRFWVGMMCIVAGLVGCSDEPGSSVGTECRTSAQCFFPQICLDGLCADSPDFVVDAGIGSFDSGTDAGIDSFDSGAIDAGDVVNGCVGACDDGNLCTHSDRCVGGQCVGTPYGCNDGNLCTDDACLGDGTCARTNNSASCDDGNAFTEGDQCAAGTCQGNACGASGTACCSGGGCQGSLSCESGTCRSCRVTNPQLAGTTQSLRCSYNQVTADGSTLQVLGQTESGRDGDCTGTSVLGTFTVADAEIGGTVRNQECGVINRVLGAGDRIDFYGPEPRGRDRDCEGSVLLGSLSVANAQAMGDLTIDCGISRITSSANLLTFYGGFRDFRGDCNRSGEIGSITLAAVRLCQ